MSVGSALTPELVSGLLQSGFHEAMSERAKSRWRSREVRRRVLSSNGGHFAVLDRLALC